GDLVKALLLRLGGHAGVHRGMLLILTGGGHLQAGQGIGDLAVFHQELEPDLGMLLLIVGGIVENGRDLLVAFLFGLGCKIGILVAGLALACESFPQVFLGLAAFEFHHTNLRFLSFVVTFQDDVLICYHYITWFPYVKPIFKNYSYYF